jgi:multicomponent Na+:H+ antiporter subunit F
MNTDLVPWAVMLLSGAATAAALLACVRLIKGPRQADRVIALDVLLASALALAVASALATGRTVFLDVAIGLALVGFVATLGWSRLIERGADRPPQE